MGIDIGDDMGALELGLRNPFRRRKGKGMKFGRVGVPKRGLHLQPLGLGTITFNATSGLILNLTGTPQRMFRGQRLVLDVTRTGATATGLISVARIDVGVDNQMVSTQGIPAAMYAPTAIDTNVRFDDCGPGITVTVQVTTTVAPGGADRIDVGGSIQGTTLS